MDTLKSGWTPYVHTRLSPPRCTIIFVRICGHIFEKIGENRVGVQGKDTDHEKS